MTEPDVEAGIAHRSRQAAARQAALTWWAGQGREDVRCDECGQVLAWGAGFLLDLEADEANGCDCTAWLVCDGCWWQVYSGAARPDPDMQSGTQNNN